MATPTFMIIPSLACQASCKYCFGPHEGAIMDSDTAIKTIEFIKSIADETHAEKLSIVFHGGEPLLAPLSVWKTLLGNIKNTLADYKVKLNLQSNLWNLDDEFIKLFIEHGVSIGTSLDGPEALCDLNRGEGYFARTNESMKKAITAGLSVSAIATITKQTLPHTLEVVKYFRNNGIPLALHGANVGIDNASVSPYALSAGEYAMLLKDLYPWYVKNRKHMSIDTLNHFVRGIVTGAPSVCTLRECFGMFVCISPNGDITSCQRLAGKAEFVMGNIFNKPTLAQLYDSPAAKRQQERENQVALRCAECEHYCVCKGGCYYNAHASGDGVIDSWCEGYKDIYSFVQEKVIEEMQSPENINAITNYPARSGEHPLLRSGKYISLAGDIHPTWIADNARRVLAIHEMGKTSDSSIAAQNLFDQKICGSTHITAGIIESMRTGLYSDKNSKNNCYAHVTFNCNLRCKHCYAEAGESKEEMAIDHFEQLVCETIDAGFRQIVITGGEPLVHTHRSELLAVCEKYKGKGTKLVLRTNLTGEFSRDDFVCLARAFDQVVVSVDGSEQTHNAQRGEGTYQNMTSNLNQYAQISATLHNAAELSLACVMSTADINAEPGQSVRKLGEKLNVRRVRFRPILPLGRAIHLEETAQCKEMQHLRPEDSLKSSVHPLTTCGIGRNLFVRPDGGAYPCYAWCGAHTFIGNVFENGLDTVLTSPQFTRLADCSVDTIEKCKDCEYRYLCGGACRAWGNQEQRNLNAAPLECTHLKERAQKLVNAAKEYILN